MGQDSKIEWTKHTFNCWRGCSKVSAGCSSCYAETLSHRNPGTLGVWGPNGSRVVAAESAWREPLKWDRAAKAAGERHRVFCASLADVFEDWRGPMVNAKGSQLGTWHGAWPWADTRGQLIEGNGFRALAMDDVRYRLFDLILATPNLDWLLLTKRPENIADSLRRIPVLKRDNVWDHLWPHRFPNVWLGVSVEDQQRADERIPPLLRVPVSVRFLSCEPLLGPVDLRSIEADFVGPGQPDTIYRPLEGRKTSVQHGFTVEGPRIDWTIVGGESGHDARPMHPDWARGLRDQCVATGTPYLFKQWGEWAPVSKPTDADEIVWAGNTYPRGRWLEPDGSAVHRTWDCVMVDRVGKKAAGRLLDGREWNEFPAPASAPNPLEAPR